MKVTKTCPCCGVGFTYQKAFGAGSNRKYCDGCSLGTHGVLDVAACKTCGKNFTRKSKTVVNCIEHRQSYGNARPRMKQCAAEGCNSLFAYAHDNRRRKFCDEHRRGRNIAKAQDTQEQPKTGCSSCFYGMASPHAESGYLCTAGLFRQCNPDIIGRHYKAREEKVG